VVIGFNIPKESDVEQEGSDVSTVVRRIANLDWVEVSSVIRGSSPSTETVAAKAAPEMGQKPAELRSKSLPENSKPFPNFHTARMRDPEDFEKFRTTTETLEGGEYDGKQVEILHGLDKEPAIGRSPAITCLPRSGRSTRRKISPTPTELLNSSRQPARTIRTQNLKTPPPTRLQTPPRPRLNECCA